MFIVDITLNVKLLRADLQCLFCLEIRILDSAVNPRDIPRSVPATMTCDVLLTALSPLSPVPASPATPVTAMTAMTEVDEIGRPV